MSALTRKMIYVDESLSTVIGFSEGELVSYTEITKGIHEYIKKNNLKMEPVKRKVDRFCFNCGTRIIAGSSYCDRCGRKQ